MIKIKQISVPTLVENGEVFIVEDGKIAFSGAVATGLKIPAGTTAERPTTTESGFVRFNTTIASLEVFNGTDWVKVGKTDVISSEDGITYVSTTETAETVVISPNGTSKLLVTATATSTELTATGSEDDINMILTPKGEGQVMVSEDYVPTAAKSVVTKDYVDRSVIPSGGLMGEALKKLSDETGDFGWVAVNNNSVGLTFYVDQHNGSDANKGTFDSPFKTITKALDSVTIAGSLIKLSVGTYNEDLTLDIPVFISGNGTYDSSVVEITGHHTVTSESTRFRLKDVILSGDNTAPLVTFDNSVGRVYFDNVSFTPTAPEDVVIKFVGDQTNWFVFKDSQIEGKVEIDNTSATPFTVYFTEGSGTTDVTLNSDNATVIATNRLRVGSIVHTLGTLILNEIGTVGGLVSTSNTGFLAVNKSSFYNSLTQTFNTATKTGTCRYSFAYSSKNPTTNWSGEQVVLANAANINSEYNPDNYLAVNKTVTGHFAGIDAQFAIIEDRLAPAGGATGTVLKKKSPATNDFDWLPETRVQVSDSETVDFTGNGYETPLSASVIISPNAGNMVVNEDGIFVPAELPDGGTTNQVLRKLSNANRDVVWANVINNSIGVTYYVDAQNGSDSFPGSFDMPFKTIQKAHDTATVANTYIVVAPGTYVEDLVITKEIFVEGSATIGSSNVVIRGLMTIGNTVIPRLRFKNVNIDAGEGNPDTVVFSDSTGKVFFDNVNINANEGTNAIRFEGSVANWFTFNGDIVGKIKIPDTLTTTDMVYVYIIDGTERPTVELGNENVLVYIERGTMGAIDHTAGHLYVANTVSVGGLNSIADNGSIRFLNSSFFDMEEGYFPATKTGTCTYIFENSSKNPVDVWVGTKINLSDAEFIDINYAPVNFTPVAKDITSNVKAIDTALGNLKDYIDYDAVIVEEDTVVTPAQSRTVFIVNNDSSKITLPLVSAVQVGFKVMVKDGFGVTTTPIVIEAAENEVIDGANVQVIEYAYESVTVVNDGTKWIIV